MEIFIRDEDKETNKIVVAENMIGDCRIVSESGGRNGGVVKMELKSLKQHNAEVRKPLEEEIAILKQQVNDWIQRFNSSEKRYRDLMISSEECIKAKEKAFYENMKNVVIHQPTQILLKDTKNIIPEIKKQERKQVIAELEEWVKENRHEVTASVGGFDYYVNDTEDLNQKLNEMKGETI